MPRRLMAKKSTAGRSWARSTMLARDDVTGISFHVTSPLIGSAAPSLAKVFDPGLPGAIKHYNKRAQFLYIVHITVT